MRALALAALLLAAPALAAPLPAMRGGELLVMNDGLKAVTAVRVRRVGETAWSPDLLAGDPVPVGEGRRIDISRMNLGCLIDVEVRVAARRDPVTGEQDVCADDPRFWMGFALGLDAPGTGGLKPGQYAVIMTEEDEEETPGGTGMTGGAPPDLNRGLPVCPGDPRCRKKK